MEQELAALKKTYDDLFATCQGVGGERDAEERQRRAAQQELGAVRRELERAERAATALEGEKGALQGQVQQLQEQVRQARRESAASALSLGSAAVLPHAAASREPGAEVERLREEVQTYRNMLRGQEHGFSLVYVKEVNHPKRYLVIGNGTNLDVSLAGWSLQARSNPEVSYELPDDAGLSAHGQLLVWWGDGAEARQYKAKPNARNYFWEERCVAVLKCPVV